MKKKIVWVTLLALVVGTGVGCGTENTRNGSKADMITESSDSEIEKLSEEKQEDDTSLVDLDFGNVKHDAQIDEAIIYDENGVKITVLNLEYGNYDAKLNVKFENTSDKEIDISSETLGYSCNSINGYMIDDGWCSVTLQPDETVEDDLKFSYNAMAIYGIKEIAYFEVGFSIHDDDFNYTYTGPIKICTDAFDSYKYDENSYRNAIQNKLFKVNYGLELTKFDEETYFNEVNVSIDSIACVKKEDESTTILIETRNKNEQPLFVSISEVEVNDICAYEYNWSVTQLNGNSMHVDTLDLESLVRMSDNETLQNDEISKVSFVVTVKNEAGNVVCEPTSITYILE